MKRYKLKKDTPAFKAETECYIEEAGNMVPCRGISYTIVHKDQLEKNPNILAEWFEEIKPTRWKPKKNHIYYCVSGDGYAAEDVWYGAQCIDDDRFDLGNCFETKEEAELVVEYLKALAAVRGDTTAEFTKGKSNYYVVYNTTYNCLDVSDNCYLIKNGIFGLPYFATKEDALRSIEQHKNEWLTIFGVKEVNENNKADRL